MSISIINIKHIISVEIGQICNDTLYIFIFSPYYSFDIEPIKSIVIHIENELIDINKVYNAFMYAFKNKLYTVDLINNKLIINFDKEIHFKFYREKKCIKINNKNKYKYD